jgi:hypothetical protein
MNNSKLRKKRSCLLFKLYSFALIVLVQHADAVLFSIWIFFDIARHVWFFFYFAFHFVNVRKSLGERDVFWKVVGCHFVHKQISICKRIAYTKAFAFRVHFDEIFNNICSVFYVVFQENFQTKFLFYFKMLR